MPLTRITIRQLEAFIVVADASSFAAASKVLSLSASAVSQLVSELENLLGFRLFDRTTRRVSLSSAGREMLGQAQSTLRNIREIESSAADVRSRAAGVVRIGAPLVLASVLLPAAVREFRQIHPKVVIHIRDVPVEGMVDHIAKGDLDLALGPDRPPDASVTNEAVFSSPWVLWCSPTHAFAKKSSLRWSDLRSVDLVAAGHDHEVSVAQMRISAAERNTVIPAEVVENITTALGIAAEGLAATLSPAYVGVVAHTRGLIMKRVKGPEIIRQVCLYRSAVRSIPPAAEAFGEFLVDWAKQWNSRLNVPQGKAGSLIATQKIGSSG
ncbi:MAG: LysR family transcriptional regulator [Rhodospirillales bacterium]|nr:LysR family transcriptional regulator [Rhodospirillales bacterium]